MESGVDKVNKAREALGNALIDYDDAVSQLLTEFIGVCHREKDLRAKFNSVELKPIRANGLAKQDVQVGQYWLPYWTFESQDKPLADRCERVVKVLGNGQDVKVQTTRTRTRFVSLKTFLHSRIYIGLTLPTDAEIVSSVKEACRLSTGNYRGPKNFKRWLTHKDLAP